MATNKQAKALEILVESGGKMPVSKAMEQAGYSPATAKTPQKLTESNAYQQLFPIDKTKATVDNLYHLSVNAEDEKNQIEATKVILDRAIPKQDTNTINNFGQMVVQAKDKYAE